jgi:DNA anti-recombination protein RmuC
MDDLLNEKRFDALANEIAQLKLANDETKRYRVEMTTRIEQIDAKLERKVDALNIKIDQRFDRMTWLMVFVLASVVINLFVTFALR